MHLIQIKWNDQTVGFSRLIEFHQLKCYSRAWLLHRNVFSSSSLSSDPFVKLFLERNDPWKGCPGRQSVSGFTFLQNNHKRTVMMTHSSRTFRPNLLRQHHRNESSNYPNHRCIGRRGRRDSQLALKHVFLIIEKRSDKRERKESKPFVCWCSVTEIHAIMVHEIGKYCNETGYFVCARFVHGTFHFCTISIVIEVRLTSSHRTPSEQALVESGNWRNARNVEWGGWTWMCT